jgi:hypothetical protein
MKPSLISSPFKEPPEDSVEAFKDIVGRHDERYTHHGGAVDAATIDDFQHETPSPEVSAESNEMCVPACTSESVPVFESEEETEPRDCRAESKGELLTYMPPSEANGADTCDGVADVEAKNDPMKITIRMLPAASDALCVDPVMQVTESPEKEPASPKKSRSKSPRRFSPRRLLKHSPKNITRAAVKEDDIMTTPRDTAESSIPAAADVEQQFIATMRDVYGKDVTVSPDVSIPPPPPTGSPWGSILNRAQQSLDAPLLSPGMHKSAKRMSPPGYATRGSGFFSLGSPSAFRKGTAGSLIHDDTSFNKSPTENIVQSFPKIHMSSYDSYDTTIGMNTGQHTSTGSRPSVQVMMENLKRLRDDLQRIEETSPSPVTQTQSDIMKPSDSASVEGSSFPQTQEMNRADGVVEDS